MITNIKYELDNKISFECHGQKFFIKEPIDVILVCESEPEKAAAAAWIQQHYGFLLSVFS
jgi:hypothetical protein